MIMMLSTRLVRQPSDDDELTLLSVLTLHPSRSLALSLSVSLSLSLLLFILHCDIPIDGDLHPSVPLLSPRACLLAFQ